MSRRDPDLVAILFLAAAMFVSDLVQPASGAAFFPPVELQCPRLSVPALPVAAQCALTAIFDEITALKP